MTKNSCKTFLWLFADSYKPVFIQMLFQYLFFFIQHCAKKKKAKHDYFYRARHILIISCQHSAAIFLCEFTTFQCFLESLISLISMQTEQQLNIMLFHQTTNMNVAQGANYRTLMLTSKFKLKHTPTFQLQLGNSGWISCTSQRKQHGYALN